MRFRVCHEVFFRSFLCLWLPGKYLGAYQHVRNFDGRLFSSIAFRWRYSQTLLVKAMTDSEVIITF